MKKTKQQIIKLFKNEFEWDSNFDLQVFLTNFTFNLNIPYPKKDNVQVILLDVNDLLPGVEDDQLVIFEFILNSNKFEINVMYNFIYTKIELLNGLWDLYEKQVKGKSLSERKKLIKKYEKEAIEKARRTA